MHFPAKTGLKSQPLKRNIPYYGLRITNSAARSLPNSSCPNGWGVRFTVCSDPPGAGPYLALVMRADWQQRQSWHTDSSTIGACHFKQDAFWSRTDLFDLLTGCLLTALTLTLTHARLEDENFTTLCNGVLSVTVRPFKKWFSCKVRQVSGKTSQ